MTDTAIELGGLRIRATDNGDGTWTLATATAASGAGDRAVEIGGVRIKAVDQGDGTYKLLVV